MKNRKKSIFMLMGGVVLIFAIILAIPQVLEMQRQNNYETAIELFNKANYTEAKEIFLKLDGYQDCAEYISRCNQEIKFLKFDYSGNNEIYSGFYDCYGVNGAPNSTVAEEEFSTWVYGTWYDENDVKVEISKEYFDGKEYGVCALGDLAALIYFCEDDSTLYELCVYPDAIAGQKMDYSKVNEYDTRIVYSRMTSTEYEEAYKKWEEQQPKYSDNEIISKTSNQTRERLSRGYSPTQRIYHSYSVDSSTVNYDWTTRTYTCFMEVTYSTNVFDIWGTETNSYSITATYRDEGNGLITTGFSLF